MLSINKASNTKCRLTERYKKLGLFIILTMAIFSPSSFSNDITPLEVTHAYMPKIPSVSRTAAVYFTVRNNSDETKTISSVSTDIARHAMFHRTIEEKGVSKMKHMGNITIAPGQEIKLVPGGMHLMLMGVSLKPSLKNIQIILEFESGEQQTLLVPITNSRD